MKASRLFLALAVLAALLALPGFSRPAAALSCVNPTNRLHEMQAVVHAEVVAVPKAQFAQLKVERYHKGGGPADLLVEFRGIGGGPNPYEWAMTPRVGDDLLLEVSRDDRGFYTGPCHLNAGYEPANEFVAQILALLGPGVPPTPVEPPPGPTEPVQGGSRALIWSIIAAGVVAVVGTVIVLRRSR